MGRQERLNRLGVVGAPAIVRDIAGRELEQGDEVMLTAPAVVRGVIQKIAPVLDPSAPPGLMELRIVTVYQYVANRNQPNAEFIRCRTREELIAAGQLKEVPPAPAGEKVEAPEEGATIVEVPDPAAGEPEVPDHGPEPRDEGPRLVSTD